MVGNEKFTYRGDEGVATVNDFWEFHYTNSFKHLDDISVFIVSVALGLKKSMR